MNHKLAIWGASGHAMVVADILRIRDEYEIIGFVDDINSVEPGQCFNGLPVFGKDHFQTLIERGDVTHLIIAIGNCQVRLRLAEWACNQGLSLVSAIHPRATVASDVSLGAGSVIAAGSVVNSGTTIGENVIINTCASVDHECVIDNGVHICPGAHLAGKVHVGQASWIGIGSSIVDRVRIGAGALIGAGAVVVKDIPDNTLAYGVPAKAIKRI